jgi:hypothetical protein
MSEIIKTGFIDNKDGVYKLGIIENVSIYNDRYCEDDKFYIGRKGSQVTAERRNSIFIVGKSTDLEYYKEIVYRFVNKRIKLKNIRK